VRFCGQVSEGAGVGGVSAGPTRAGGRASPARRRRRRERESPEVPFGANAPRRLERPWPRGFRPEGDPMRAVERRWCRRRSLARAESQHRPSPEGRGSQKDSATVFYTGGKSSFFSRRLKGIISLRMTAVRATFLWFPFLDQLLLRFDQPDRHGQNTGSCHLFRHTCATLMHENSADIRLVQQLLGLADP